jgi:hypothetical protein
MTTAGSVDLFSAEVIDNSAKKKVQYAFGKLYAFLSGTCGSAGYSELVANNYGTGGTGMDPADGAAPCGDNAWAVFRWLSGSSSRRAYDLYVMIQAYMTEQTFGGASSGSIGWPAVLSGQAGYGSIGIQCAWTLDGTDPWRGTRQKNGLDDKGIPIWNTGSTTYVLPCPNNADGLYYASRNYYARTVTAVAGQNYVYNFVANEDFICILNSYAGNVDPERFMFISTVDVIPALSGALSASMPICMHNLASNYAAQYFGFPTTAVANVYGDSYASTYSDIYDGGTFTNSNTFHQPSRVTYIYNSTALHENNLLYNGTSPSGSIDVYPYYVYSYTDVHGLLGTVSEIYLCNSSSPKNILLTGSLNGNQYAVFRTKPSITCACWVLPWSGSAPREILIRDGRQW